MARDEGCGRGGDVASEGARGREVARWGSSGRGEGREVVRGQ